MKIPAGSMKQIQEMVMGMLPYEQPFRPESKREKQ